MTTGIQTWNDFRGLAELRADAVQQSPEAAREAARQFEALFVQMMLKSMRDATAVLGEDRDRTYDEMFDQQIALEMTRGKGLGLADMLVRQLRLTGAAPTGPDATPAAGVDGLPAAAMPAPATTAPAPVAPVVPQATAFVGPPTPVTTTTPPVTNAGASSAGPPAPAQPAEAAAPPPPAADFRPGTPTEFVHALWPHAERAGRELGIDPRAIVAQAALETGWGQRQIRDADGRSAFNLFGIKADGNWDGRRIGVTTLEYEAGLPAPVRAQFRGYGSLAEGVADYVRFLRGNARYGTALGAGSGAGFAAGLQSAGYATDPRYATKIRNILESPGLNAAIDALKTGDRLPMQAATTS